MANLICPFMQEDCKVNCALYFTSDASPFGGCSILKINLELRRLSDDINNINQTLHNIRSNLPQR